MATSYRQKPEIINNALSELLTRNYNILYSLVDFLKEEGVVNPDKFIDYCNRLASNEFLSEIWRTEGEARSHNSIMHPGGEEATISLANLADINNNDIVLDAGTGHAGSARILAEKFDCKIIAFDAKFVRLVDAIYRTKNHFTNKSISFRHTDAYNMSFSEEVFDVVFRQHSVYGGNEIDFIKECNRILKKGGRIAFHGTFTNMSLMNKDKRKLEEYCAEEYFELLAQQGFELCKFEFEKSTQELLESYQKHKRDDDRTNISMINLIKNNRIIGFKLVAVKK